MQKYLDLSIGHSLQLDAFLEAVPALDMNYMIDALSNDYAHPSRWIARLFSEDES